MITYAINKCFSTGALGIRIAESSGCALAWLSDLSHIQVMPQVVMIQPYHGHSPKRKRWLEESKGDQNVEQVQKVQCINEKRHKQDSKQPQERNEKWRAPGPRLQMKNILGDCNGIHARSRKKQKIVGTDCGGSFLFDHIRLVMSSHA